MITLTKEFHKGVLFYSMFIAIIILIFNKIWTVPFFIAIGHSIMSYIYIKRNK